MKKRFISMIMSLVMLFVLAMPTSVTVHADPTPIKIQNYATGQYMSYQNASDMTCIEMKSLNASGYQQTFCATTYTSGIVLWLYGYSNSLAVGIYSYPPTQLRVRSSGFSTYGITVQSVGNNLVQLRSTYDSDYIVAASGGYAVLVPEAQISDITTTYWNIMW